MIVNCNNCGTPFDKQPKEIEKSKNHYCSRSCAAKTNNKGRTRNKPKERHCIGCGNPYFYTNNKRRKYCEPCRDKRKASANSANNLKVKTSANSINNLKVKWVAKIHICKNCDTPYTNTNGHRSGAFCVDCKIKWKTGQLRPMPDDYSLILNNQEENNLNKTEVNKYYTCNSKSRKDMTIGSYHEFLSVKGKHPSWANSHIRALNRSWNKHLAKHPCITCGYKNHVELAHIRDITDFPLSATMGEVNHPSNVIPLCRNCHWEFDNEIMNDENLNKINQWQEEKKVKKNNKIK